MKWIVFSGPSLSPAEVEKQSGGLAVARGPASCGDIFVAQEHGAEVILLIDGYFEHRLAVWHKEILWALSRGVRVYGAASLGALRAVELESYGMVGVGRVFQLFKDGTLEDEDEVAVAHESAERGYRATSDAMVNIRATLDRAVDAGVLQRDAAESLVTMAKTEFYPSRRWPALIGAAAQAGIVGERDPLLRWLRGNAVDRKRLDAEDAIRQVRAELASATATPAKTPFHFEYTEAWHELLQQLRRSHRGITG